MSETVLGGGVAAIGDDDGGDGTLQTRRDQQWRCTVGDEYVVDGVLQFCLQ